MILPLIVLIIATTILVGCGERDKDSYSNETPNIVENDDKDDKEDILEDEEVEDEDDNEINIEIDRAHDFLLPNIEGDKVALNDFNGRPVILSFWVSWNEYSVNQLERLQNVYPLLEEDIVFIAVNVASFETKSEEDLKNYIKDKSFSYEFLIDETGDVAKSYYIGSFPTTFFINDEGNVTKMVTTNMKEDEILDEVELLLEGY